MPFPLLPLIGAGISAAGSIFGALGQNQANQQNFDAQQAWQRFMQQQVQGQMLGQNQYAQQMAGLFGANPQLMQPGTIDPFTYQAAQGQAPGLGAAPMVGAQNPLSFLTVNPSGQVGGPAGTAPVNVPLVGAPGLGSAFNTGQDALMQMLNRSYGPAMDGGLQSSLEGLYGGSEFDANRLIEALAPVDNRLIEQQASALRGSAGSLGQRFGSAMGQDEQRLRSTFAQDVSARNAGLFQQMFESSQNRRLQALGLGAQQQQFASQFPLMAAQTQQNAAQQLMQGALSQGGMNQQAQLANAANILQAQGIDVNAMLQTQALGQQGQQFNIQQAMQAALANQGAGMQTGQFNAQQAMQAALANQQMMGQFGLQGGQNMLQMALANLGAQNQAGQFNAQMGFNAANANNQQANIFNQMLMSGLGQANQMQMGNNQLNAQLLGILGGLQVPQQQPNQMGGALGSIGMLGALLPMLLGQGGGGSQQQIFQTPSWLTGGV
jgi:hypothetical protein